MKKIRPLLMLLSTLCLAGLCGCTSERKTNLPEKEAKPLESIEEPGSSYPENFEQSLEEQDAEQNNSDSESNENGGSEAPEKKPKSGKRKKRPKKPPIGRRLRRPIPINPRPITPPKPNL